MKGQKERPLGAVGLKEAICGDLCVFADPEQPALRRRQIRK
jgi:hypothetical protein